MVVVIMIIGMIASMAIPRMSRGATGASRASLGGNLNVVRKAILYYSIEHANKFPGNTADKVVAQLTQYSTMSGETAPAGGPTVPYGPYLVSIPPCPIGFHPGSSKILIDSVNSPPHGDKTTEAGWVYNPKSGEFYPNATNAVISALFDGSSDTMSDAELTAKE